ncbi:MAG: hypothetical protein PHF84_01685 [bacterium]|nr:hypothetical protein [bacterium]
MKAEVELRKFPYPFQAALSICSDIDHTDSAGKFLKIQEFMNKEIGITFTNTFFPFHEKDEFSLFSSCPDDKKIIIEHIRNGNIEAFHGYGEKDDFIRKDAQRTLAELRKNDVFLKMWIDHASFPGNLCKYRCFGKGDIPGQKEYHLDLTADYGVKYIWTDSLTSIVGQDAPVTLKSILLIIDFKHFFSSGLNAVKTVLKIIMGLLKSKKYRFFPANKPVHIITLRDKRKMYEFIRYNNYFKGAAAGDSFSELYYLISKKVLKNLISRKAYSLVYVHLGKNFDLDQDKNRLTIQALRNLRQEADSGRIYVASSLRLLDYYIKHKYLNWDYSLVNGNGCITIKSIDDPVRGSYIPGPEDLMNFTFYVPDHVNIKIKINQLEIKRILKNKLDYSGKMSISIG